MTVAAAEEAAPAVDLHAVAVGSPAANPFSVSSFFPPHVVLTVRNAGDLAAGAFAVHVEYEYRGAWHTLSTFTHGPVGPGVEVSTVVPWNQATLVGSFPVRATLDPGHEVPDPLVENNVVSGLGYRYTAAVQGVDALNP